MNICIYYFFKITIVTAISKATRFGEWGRHSIVIKVTLDANGDSMA